MRSTRNPSSSSGSASSESDPVNRYIVIEVGCLECESAANPSIELRTDDLEEAKTFAADIGRYNDHDRFIVDLHEGAVIKSRAHDDL